MLTGGTGILYFTVFTAIIKKFNVQTPGREVSVNVEIVENANLGKKSRTKISKNDKYATLASDIISAIGAENFISVDNCATRLRLVVKDTSQIDKEKIKAAGAFGVVILTKESLQVIIGPDVEHVANLMKETLNL